MENTLNKAILKNQLTFGRETALGLLYARYGAMLFEFVIQFVEDRAEAEKILVIIFEKLSSRLAEAFASPLGIYCWMQREARKIIIDYRNTNLSNPGNQPNGRSCGNTRYLRLLQEATEEHRQVFREIFYDGHPKEEIARHLGKETGVVNRLLRECLLTIRKKLL